MTLACTFSFDTELYPDPEDAAYVLNETFERAVQICDNNQLKVWLDNGEQQLLDEKTIDLKIQGLTLTELEAIAEQNWNQNCPELYARLTLGQFTICPLPSPDAAEGQALPGEIRIIPGTGFGTGHHPTTAMLIKMLQELPHLSTPHTAQDTTLRILDLGTGSGLLAIVAEKIFNSNIDAVDIDELALKNAFDNLELNNCQKIKLRQGSIDAATGPYELVIANLYAELLIEFCEQIYNLTVPGGILLISGIMLERLELVKSAFSEPTWRIITECQEAQWAAIKLIRE